MRIRGGGGVVHVASDIPPLLKQRIPIAEPRIFSENISRLLLLLPFTSSVSVSNLAIVVAAAFCKNLVTLASTIDLRKTADRATLGAHVTLVEGLQRIDVF